MAFVQVINSVVTNLMKVIDRFDSHEMTNCCTGT